MKKKKIWRAGAGIMAAAVVFSQIGYAPVYAQTPQGESSVDLTEEGGGGNARGEGAAELATDSDAGKSLGNLKIPGAKNAANRLDQEEEELLTAPEPRSIRETKISDEDPSPCYFLEFDSSDRKFLEAIEELSVEGTAADGLSDMEGFFYLQGVNYCYLVDVEKHGIYVSLLEGETSMDGMEITIGAEGYEEASFTASVDEGEQETGKTAPQPVSAKISDGSYTVYPEGYFYVVQFAVDSNDPRCDAAIDFIDSITGVRVNGVDYKSVTVSTDLETMPNLYYCESYAGTSVLISAKGQLEGDPSKDAKIVFTAEGYEDLTVTVKQAKKAEPKEAPEYVSIERKEQEGVSFYEIQFGEDAKTYLTSIEQMWLNGDNRADDIGSLDVMLAVGDAYPCYVVDADAGKIYVAGGGALKEDGTDELQIDAGEFEDYTLALTDGQRAGEKEAPEPRKAKVSDGSFILYPAGNYFVVQFAEDSNDPQSLEAIEYIKKISAVSVGGVKYAESQVNTPLETTKNLYYREPAAGTSVFLSVLGELEGNPSESVPVTFSAEGYEDLTIRVNKVAPPEIPEAPRYKSIEKLEADGFHLYAVQFGEGTEAYLNALTRAWLNENDSLADMEDLELVRGVGSAYPCYCLDKENGILYVADGGTAAGDGTDSLKLVAEGFADYSFRLKTAGQETEEKEAPAPRKTGVSDGSFMIYPKGNYYVVQFAVDSSDPQSEAAMEYIRSITEVLVQGKPYKKSESNTPLEETKNLYYLEPTAATSVFLSVLGELEGDSSESADIVFKANGYEDLTVTVKKVRADSKRKAPALRSVSVTEEDGFRVYTIQFDEAAEEYLSEVTGVEQGLESYLDMGDLDTLKFVGADIKAYCVDLPNHRIYISDGGEAAEKGVEIRILAGDAYESYEVQLTGGTQGGEDPEKPGTGEEKPGTGEEKPGTGEEKPGTGEETPGTGGNHHSGGGSSRGGGLASLRQTALKTTPGSWVLNQDGSWTFKRMDEKSIAGTWQYLSSSAGNGWYHFGNDSRMNVGWLLDSDGSWYYLDKASGAMKTGWILTEDGRWYYLNPADGRMMTGWKNIGGREYYLNPVGYGATWTKGTDGLWTWTGKDAMPYGAMYSNAVTPDGRTVGSDGAAL